MANIKIDLCNSALLLLGAKTIASFDEASTEAVVCEQFYERSYTALINVFLWKFATKYQQLAILSGVTPPDPYFKYAFQLPTDMIWLQHILPNRSTYKVIGDQLHATIDELQIKYTYRADEELMSPLTQQTLVYYLASQMCITLTEDTSKQANMYLQYQDHLKRAKAVDSQMQPQDQFADFPIDSARYGS